MCVVGTGHFNIYYVTRLFLNRQLLQFSLACMAWLSLSFGEGIWGGSLFLLMIRFYVLRTVLLFYLAVIGLSLSEMNVNLAAWLARVSSTHPRDSRKLNLSFGDAQMPRIWREGNGLKLGMGSISSRLILIFGAQTLGAFNRALNPKPSGLNPCPKPFP